MTQDEKILQALADLEQMKKDVEKLQSMNLDSAFQTGGPRAYRGSAAKKVQHGTVIIRVKDGLLRASDGETVVPGPVAGILVNPENPDGMDHSLPRTSTPMRSKHQRSMIEKIWKYRNFKKCGNCGCFDTYKSRCLDDTQDIEFWCYQCGAQEEDVTKEFEPLPEARHKQRECALCGKEIWATRGEKMFPTGEVDTATGRPDYCCEKCNLASKK